MSTSQFSGLGVALATPFDPTGELDLAALARLIRHVLQGGVQTLVTLGTTGEAATLDEAERKRVILTTLAEAGSTPVVAGTGHNNFFY